MTYPTLAVRVSFGTDRFDTPSYSSLPATDVEALSIDIGRHSELDGTNPGTLDVVLDNTSRDYDPRHTGGAHYPDVTSGKKVQLTATRGGVTYQVFNGWADGWPNASSRQTARATLKASGAFRWLSRTRVHDVYADEVEADNPTVWYRLSDSSAHTLTDSGGLGYDGYWVPESRPITTVEGVIDSEDGATKLEAAPQWCIGNIPQFPATWRGMTMELWFRIDQLPDPVADDQSAFLFAGGGLGLGVVTEGFSNSGQLGFSIAQAFGAAPTKVVTSGDDPTWITVCDGRPHHVVCILNYAGDTLEMWLDGANVGVEPVTAGVTITGGGPWATLQLNWSPAWNGDCVIDELAFYGDPLTESRIIAHSVAGRPAGAGDLTGERVDRILDQIDWPAGLRDVDDGQAFLSASTAVGDVVLGYLRVVADSEQALLSEAHDDDGKVRFQDRGGRLTDTRSSTVQTLFSDDPTDIASNGAVVYTAVGLPAADTPVSNVVTVKWLGGDVTVTDQASVDAHGDIPTTVDTILTLRAEAENLANWLLDHRSISAANGVQSVTIDPSPMTGTAADRAWTACLARKIGDRVRIVHTPTGTGTEIDHEAYIIGITHQADSGAERWSTTFYLSPAVTAVYWILGTSQLGVDTMLAF